MTTPEPEKKPQIRTLDIKPRAKDAIKPAELIQVTGHHDLTLNARRSITILWHNAHSQGIEEGRDYTIEIDDLKPDGHKGYEMVEEAIVALMKTLLVVKMANGTTRRVQFLGGNDLDSEDRPAGVLTYSFDKRLIEMLKESLIWGKISLPVLMAFTTKYAVSLYENIAQMFNLSYKTFHEYSLEEFREMLGIPAGKYRTFGELNLHVIKPVVAEINGLAPFGISVHPLKKGKRVDRVSVSWWQKDSQMLSDSQQELRNTKLGRRARLAGLTEHVHDPMVTSNRLVRKARKERLTP